MRHRRIPSVATLLGLLALTSCHEGCFQSPVKPGDLGCALYGTVFHPDGSPYANARVNAQTVAAFAGVYELSTDTSLANGRFYLDRELRCLVPYTVSVIQGDSFAVATTATPPVTDMLLRLQQATVLRGFAVRADAPAKAGVSVATDLPRSSVLTDSSGFYEIRTVAPGRRRVLALDPLDKAAAGVFVDAIAGDTLLLDTLHLALTPITPTSPTR